MLYLHHNNIGKRKEYLLSKLTKTELSTEHVVQRHEPDEWKCYDLQDYDESIDIEKSLEITEFCSNCVNEAKDYFIELDKDPIKAGIYTLNDKIARCREMANRVTLLQVNAIRILGQLEDQIELLSATINSTIDRIKDSAEDCKKARGYEEKRNLAEQYIPNYIKSQTYLKRRIEEVNGCLKALGLHAKNLASTKDDILAQIGVIKQQILIGEVSVQFDKQTVKAIVHTFYESENTL